MQSGVVPPHSVVKRIRAYKYGECAIEMRPHHISTVLVQIQRRPSYQLHLIAPKYNE